MFLIGPNNEHINIARQYLVEKLSIITLIPIKDGNNKLKYLNLFLRYVIHIKVLLSTGVTLNHATKMTLLMVDSERKLKNY